MNIFIVATNAMRWKCRTRQSSIHSHTQRIHQGKNRKRQSEKESKIRTKMENARKCPAPGLMEYFRLCHTILFAYKYRYYSQFSTFQISLLPISIMNGIYALYRLNYTESTLHIKMDAADDINACKHTFHFIHGVSWWSYSLSHSLRCHSQPVPILRSDQM